MPQLQLHDARDPDASLYYQVYGHGPEKVIFIMGYMGTHRLWGAQAAFFAKRPELFQVVIFDNRGVGNSTEVPTLSWTTLDMAHDALQLVDSLGWGKVHVVGNSMGGMIAQHLALLLGRRVKSLTLGATHAGGTTVPLKGQLLMAKSNLASDHEKLATISLELLFGSRTQSDPKAKAHHHAQQIRLYRAGRKPTLWAAFTQMVAVYRHHLRYDQLLQIRALDAPKLVVVGTEDLLVRTSNSHMLARVLGTPVVVLQDMGHTIAVEAADTFNDLLLHHFMSATNGASHTAITVTGNTSAAGASDDEPAPDISTQTPRPEILRQGHRLSVCEAQQTASFNALVRAVVKHRCTHHGPCWVHWARKMIKAAAAAFVAIKVAAITRVAYVLATTRRMPEKALLPPRWSRAQLPAFVAIAATAALWHAGHCTANRIGQWWDARSSKRSGTAGKWLREWTRFPWLAASTSTITALVLARALKDLGRLLVVSAT